MEILKQSIMNYKIIFLLPVMMCIVFITHAQIQYIPAGAHPFSISLGGGITSTFGDLKKTVYKPAIRGNLDYNITPFISAGIEGQYGKLASGETVVNANSEGLYSESNFYAVNANIRAGLGQLLKAPENSFSQLIGGFYIGAGVGFINSELQSVVRNYPVGGAPIKGTIEEETTEMVIPLNVGLNVDLPVYRLGANLNFQYNLTQGEALDGYNFNVIANNDNDAYSFLSIVVRYYFGDIR